MENMNKLKELLQDESFATKLFNLDDPKDIQKLLSDNGVELSIEEIEQTKDFVQRYNDSKLTEAEKKAVDAYLENDGDALSDEQLEAVNGGFIGFAIFGLVLAVGAISGMVYHDVTGRSW